MSVILRQKFLKKLQSGEDRMKRKYFTALFQYYVDFIFCIASSNYRSVNEIFAGLA